MRSYGSFIVVLGGVLVIDVVIIIKLWLLDVSFGDFYFNWRRNGFLWKMEKMIIDFLGFF